MTNTKARHKEIYTAAVRALEIAGGIEVIDALSKDERILQLRKSAKWIEGMTNCHIDSAKRNLAKAIRRARYGLMQEASQWGGRRNPPGGRPPKEDQMKPNDKKEKANRAQKK